MDFINDPVKFIADWLSGLLGNWGLAENIVELIITTIGVVVVASFGLTLVIALIWVERKVAARFQDRLGPNRAGPYGLFQTFADILKLFTKEDTTPDGADKVVFNIAPVLGVFAVLLLWAIIPFSEKWIGTDLNVGILYIVAVGSLGILSVLMAGWSSNNKFALLGAFRTVAQMVSFEVPMVLALMVPVLIVSSMGLGDIVSAQDGFFSMLIWSSPIAALIFFISSVAEVGRTPFDLLEAESEIVAGFHTEYSGAKFAMIFAGEFLHAFTISVLTASLFFGGWQGPGAENSQILGWVYFMVKSMLVYFVVIWVRSSLPRIRIDHMLNLNWKLLTPLSLVTLIVTALVVKLVENPGTQTASLFVANILILWIFVSIIKRRESEKPPRVTVGVPRPVAVPPPAEIEAGAD